MSERPEPRVYFAFRSPYSRLGLHKLSAAGITPRLIPFQAPAAGAPFADPLQNKPKLAYYAQDVGRMTVRMGLPLALPDPFDVDPAPANRAFIAADRAGAGLAFALAVSDARWGDGDNISELSVLDRCGEAAGLGSDFARRANDDDTTATALADAQAAVEDDGVFGVPFLVWGENKYWGQDRFDLFLEDFMAPAAQ